MAIRRPVRVVDTTSIDELGAWLAMCEALGITVVDNGCGNYTLTVPQGVAVPAPPPWR